MHYFEVDKEELVLDSFTDWQPKRDVMKHIYRQLRYKLNRQSVCTTGCYYSRSRLEHWSDVMYPCGEVPSQYELQYVFCATSRQLRYKPNRQPVCTLYNTMLLYSVQNSTGFLRQISIHIFATWQG